MTNLIVDLLNKKVHLTGNSLSEEYVFYKLPEIGLTHYEIKCKDKEDNLIFLRLHVRHTNLLIRGIDEEQIKEM